MHLLILPACLVELSSDVLISIKVYRPVHQNTADKATNLFHVRQLCPLKYEKYNSSVQPAFTDLISIRVVGLHTAENGLVLTKSASDINSALMGDHGAAKPGE